MLLKFFKYKCVLSLIVMILIIRITHCESNKLLLQSFPQNHHEFSSREIPQKFDKNTMESLHQGQTPNAIKQAEDRNSYDRLILRSKRRKLKWFKRELKRCRHLSRQKFKFIRKSDDDGDEYDTIRIKIPNEIPYGYQDEYFPLSLRRSRNETSRDMEHIGYTYYDEEDKLDNDNDVENNEYQNIVNDTVNWNLEEYQTHTFRNSQTNQITKNNAPTSQISGLLRLPIYSTRYQQFEAVPSQSSYFRQYVPKRSWSYPARWRISRQGILPSSYHLKEPVPGLFRGTPPSISIKKNVQDMLVEKIRGIMNINKSLTNVHEFTQTPYNTMNNNIPTFNTRYSKPYYSIYGGYSDVIQSNNLKMKNTEMKEDETKTSPQKFVVTPSGWASTLFYPPNNKTNKNHEIIKKYNQNSEANLNSKGDLKYTRHEYVGRLDNEKDFLNKNDVDSENNWMPVNINYLAESEKDKLSGRGHALNYVETLPLPYQQIQSLIPNTYFEGDTKTVTPTTKNLDIITAKYPFEDKNNIPYPTQQNKPTLLITEKSMEQFNPNKTLVDFNVVDNKKVKTENVVHKDLKKVHIPSVNSTEIGSSLSHISVLVSSSMLVKEN